MFGFWPKRSLGASDFPLDPLSGEFRKRSVERAYRHWIWNETASTVRVALYLTIFMTWAFVYNDYVFVGLGPLFAVLMALRVAGTVLCFALARLSRRRTNIRLVERTVVPWVLIACALSLAVMLTRPPGYLLPTIQHIAGAFAIYLFVPFHLPAVGLVLVSAGVFEVGLFAWQGAAGIPQLTLLAVSFALTNALGYLTSRRLNVLRRQDFVSRLTERRARRVLQTQIAERRRTERELEEARHAAENANAAKSAFLASMSHEIRTPLTGVLGFAQLLSDTPLTGTQREHLKVIERSGRNLTRLLNDILDLSKVEAGRLAIENEAFELADTIVQTVRLNEPKAEARGVKIRLSRPELPGPIWLTGDPDRLQQVIGNLLDNALKYAKRSDVEVILSIEPERAARRQVRIEVLDRGPGIPDAIKETVFEPYVLGAASAHDGGAGLGLAICRRIVELMGGTISVSDRIGGGARFCVDLAMAVAEPSGLARHDTSIAPEAAGPALSVLLVDDDEVNRLLISTVLARAGHQVDTAADGRQGVDAALSRRYDAILMDMRMPVMDGLAAIAELRARPDGPNAATPILAMTANVMDSQVAAYEQAGADGVIAKPIDFLALQHRLEELTAPRRVAEPAAFEDETLVDLKVLNQLVESLGEEGAARAEEQFADSAPLLLRALAAAPDAGHGRRIAARLVNAAESLGLADLAQAAAISDPTALAGLEVLLAQSIEALGGAMRKLRRKGASVNADAG